MKRRTKGHGRIGAFLAVMLVATLLPLASFGAALAATTGLQNPGFEDGLAEWNTVKISDTVDVVATEGPAQFPAYADTDNVTVSPYSGNLMLRLGSPKRLAESQPKGPNTVSQTFTADSETLLFAFRLFSWEFRDQDLFSFDVKDGKTSVGQVTALDGSSPLLIPMPNDTTLNLSAFPRTWTISVGGRGPYLDTGWVSVMITGLPIGKSLTLSFSTGGTKDNGHATWAYFDNANRPPVAKFSFGPLEPYEGDIVQLMDGSYDPDPGDRIVSWDWDVKWIDPEGEQLHSYSEARNPFFVPPDEETEYSVTLTVTDTWGASTTITNGQVPIDGYLYYPASDPPNVPFEPVDHKVPLLSVENAPPLVNALNIEALPGQTITLIGRFLDPGWLDTHSANWAAASVGSGNMKLLEDNTAFLTSGITTWEITAPTVTGDYAGTLTVTDNDGGSNSDNFTIHVVPDLPESREPDNDIPLAESSQVPGGGIYLSYIQSAGDVDLFEVTLPGGQPLPAGSDILVTLKGLPADYDLVMFSQSAHDTAGFQESPFQQNSFQASPFTRSPFTRSPYVMAPFTRSPFTRSPFTRSPFTRSPFTRSPFTRSPFTRSPFTRSPFTRSSFGQYPLSEMGYTGLDAADIGGTDISLAELGLGSISESLTPIGFSANRGLENETLLVRSEIDGTRYYIAVVGANESFSATPYQLQIEASQPPDLAGWLGDEGFTYDAPVDNWDNSGLYQDNLTPYVVPETDIDSPLTLFVTQRERMQGLYGVAQWNSLVSSLTDLADEIAIQGKIISVPIGIYEDADNNANDIAALNEVGETIRTVIRNQVSQNPTIEYIVIVGSDDIIPSYRVPDETIISNERDYLMSSFVTPGSPLFYSLLGGWNLTDDYYVDLDPLIPWQGRTLYLPDLAIGRMVETPEEIMAAADAFTASGGVLDPGSALVTGYDFFSDGSTVLSSILGADTALISDTWTAAELADELLSGNYTISAINAHFAHYAALSAFGFTEDLPDILSSEEVAQASGDPLANTLVMTMGCHAGLNVTDAYSELADPGLGVIPALDFPQAMAQQHAIFVASKGFGLGDDEGIGGTERLINIFAASLMNDGVTVGQSLVLAKQGYLGSLSTMTVYDEKSSIQFALYGLPQYQVGAPAQAVTTSAVSPLSQIASASLTGASANMALGPIVFQRVDTDSGDYFTVDGDAQATAFRPIQPRVVLPIAPSDDGPVHGVLLQGGGYIDLAEFDPVITRPTREGEADVSELQIALPALWPATLASVNTIETLDGAIQNLVVIPGQFQPTGFSDGEVIGIQRLYADLDFELLRSSLDDDFEPPVVSGIDLSLSGDVINIGVAASDDQSGIARIVVLIFRDGEVISTDLVVSGTPQSGYFTLAVPGTTADRMIIQVADGAGNVAAATGKGAYLRAIDAAIQPDQCSSEGYTVAIAGTIRGFANLTGPVFYTLSFGDGESASGMLPADADYFEVNENGDALFTIEHTYADFNQAFAIRLKVTDSAGGIGVSRVTLLLDLKGDANSDILGHLPDADFVGGQVTNDGMTMTVVLRVDGVVNGEYQYRVTVGKALLKYDGGKATGLKSLTAVVVGNELRLTFKLSDLKLNAGDQVSLVLETQAGVPGTGSTGFVDRMPDSGSFLYIIQ